MKMKEFGPSGGRVPGAPLDPPMSRPSYQSHYAVSIAGVILLCFEPEIADVVAFNESDVWKLNRDFKGSIITHLYSNFLQTYMAVEYFSTPGNWVKLLNSNEEAEYMVYWLIPGTFKEEDVKRKTVRQLRISERF